MSALFDNLHPWFGDQAVRAAASAPVAPQLVATYITTCDDCMELGVTCNAHQAILEDVQRWQPGRDDNTTTVFMDPIA